ncbi:MAG: mannose-1-phosphate guanylyltransferase/mannose-6-phosphate isomerase, partial [Pseudomonadota bacterium]
FNPPIIVCNESHANVVTTQADALGIELGKIICEPAGRDTAPAIALCIEVTENASEQRFLVMPSDHEVSSKILFQKTLADALPIVDDGKIVLFGVNPNRAETGYGYLRAGDRIDDSECFNIEEFIEKPAQQTAELLVQEPNVYWNAGIFFFRGEAILAEFLKFSPVLLQFIQKSVRQGTSSGKFFHPEAGAFMEIENVSVDYAVMEKTNIGAMACMKSAWSDLGSWTSIWENSAQDADGNSIRGNVLDVDSENCLIHSDGPTVGTCGLQDMIVVANRDAILISPKSNVQGVKNLVTGLKKKGSPTVSFQPQESRPWGEFESINRGESHQVKRIVVAPGGRLSLQYHFHRCEHWIVVKGIATVTINEEVSQLGASQQIFIPQGATHRLENFTDEPVEIIEVQYGDYLGEDDIVRVEDIYKRTVRSANG